MVDEFKPVTVMPCEDPVASGVGSPIACAVEFQLATVINEVEYLKSYTEAVPAFPSSPGAVQERVMELTVGLDAVKSVIAAGEVVSGGDKVVADAVLDCEDELPAAS